MLGNGSGSGDTPPPCLPNADADHALHRPTYPRCAHADSHTAVGVLGVVVVVVVRQAVFKCLPLF